MSLLLWALFALSATPHVLATLLGRYVIVRHRGARFRALHIDGATWRALDLPQRAGTFLLPLVIDVVLVAALLLTTGFMQSVGSPESLIDPVPGGAAERAGLRVEDRVVRVEDRDVSTFAEMREAITEAAAKKPVIAVVVDREGARESFQVEHRDARIGVRAVVRDATFSEALDFAVDLPVSVWSSIGLLVIGSPDVRVGGPADMTRMVAQTPEQRHGQLIMSLLSMWAVMTWWLVLVLCAIGTPWRAVFSRSIAR